MLNRDSDGNGMVLCRSQAGAGGTSNLEQEVLSHGYRVQEYCPHSTGRVADVRRCARRPRWRWVCHPSSAATTAHPSLYSIHHIVVFMQENRSADSYLAQLSALQPAYEAEPTTGNPNPIGPGTIVPFHKSALCETSDLNHSWNGEHQAWDNGAMDGFTAANDINSRQLGSF